MELLFGAVVIIFLLFFMLGWGFKIGQRRARETQGFASYDVERSLIEDRNSLFYTWRREIANILIWHDPDRYLQLYRSLDQEVAAYRNWKLPALQAKRNELAKRYPLYQDFDAIGTRIHVLYGDGMNSYSELEERFADITRFQGLLCAIAPEWQRFPATSDDELYHLTDYAEKLKDTKFLLRMERAIEDYEIWNSAQRDSQWGVFDYGDLTVKRVSHFAELRYGIHFKDTNEFGLHGIFYFDDKFDDDGSPAMHESYYRSDSLFEKEGRLDVLPDVAEAIRKQLKPLPAEESGKLDRKRI